MFSIRYNITTSIIVTYLFYDTEHIDFSVNESRLLAFSPSASTELCLTIDIEQDDIVEDNETVSLQLLSTNNRIIFDPGSATITITDDDSKHIKNI